MMLAAQSLSKTYRKIHALVDVSLEIPAGSFTLLTGPSGSGKTTLLALLGALERPTSGKALFDGRDLAACSDAELARQRRRMGFVFQDAGLIPGLPAWENVTYHLIPRGIGRAECRRQADEALSALGLSERLTSRPAELSGGEQQRLGIARALLGRPDVILADEPTSNLDDAAVQTVTGLLRRELIRGATIVVASHDPRFAALATQTMTLRGK